MRSKITMFLALVAVLATVAVPAVAQSRADRIEDRFDNDGFFFIDGDGFDRDRFDGDRFDNGFFDGNGDGFNDGGVSQDIEQEIDETGDVDQTFEVTGGGDNSNQCANVQGAANTGNVQTGSAFLQYASDIEDFESEDNEASLSVNPTSTVSCGQQVNQAAAAG